MHYKYSSLLNITFITMMYGAGLPILFPTAACSYVVVYLLEKFMMYFCYKSPPAYDEKLNDYALNTMTYAPCFLLGFGYWMLSNLQLQGNTLTPKDHKGDAFIAEHYWYTCVNPMTVFNSGPAGILIVFFYAYCIYLLFKNTIG